MAACCATKPRKASIAKRAFLISLSFKSATLLALPLVRPRISKGPPGYPETPVPLKEFSKPCRSCGYFSCRLMRNYFMTYSVYMPNKQRTKKLPGSPWLPGFFMSSNLLISTKLNKKNMVINKESNGIPFCSRTTSFSHQAGM